MTMLGTADIAKPSRSVNGLLSARQVRQVRMDVDLWNEAWQLFKKYDDKEFSFVDCASFVRHAARTGVMSFTFDHHFEQMGFRLWPGGK